MHRRYLLSFALEAAVSLTPIAPALAFDDGEFCVAAQQLALAANRDINLWIDRVTRNDGMAVSCDRRLVEFKRFVTARASTMDGSWNERKTEEWNAAHCYNRIWVDAIHNGWSIAATYTSSDGTRISFRATCK